LNQSISDQDSGSEYSVGEITGKRDGDVDPYFVQTLIDQRAQMEHLLDWVNTKGVNSEG